MSQLKLRAWDELNKVMHYDFEYIATGSEGDDWIIFKSDKQTLKDGNVFDNPYMRKQFHIMQSTGTFDKNGKEIFEGDIVKGIKKNKYQGQSSVFVDGLLIQPFSYLDCYDTELFEVIGNIHEQPNLVED